MASNTIIEQVETTYDAAGAVIQSTTRQRYHNASAAQTGPLQNPTTTPKARVTYQATYPDAIGRTVAVANYGTNGGTALARSSTIPVRSDTILITSTGYDSTGNMATQTNPAGISTCFSYDAAGRKTVITMNCVTGSSSSSSSNSSSSSSASACLPSDDVNVTVINTYNADGNLASVTANNGTTSNQTTQYVYGTTLSDSAIASSLLKRSEIYPDSIGGSDQVLFSYNRQGQQTSEKQRGRSSFAVAM